MPKRSKAGKRHAKARPRKKMRVAAKTRVEQVASPWNNGFDRVTRVIDTIGAMKKRRQISEQEYEAAARFRWAFESCHGGIKSALNDSTVATTEPSWKAPSDHMMKAAEIIKEARNLLGVTDYQILQMVAGQGMTVEETAGHLYGRVATGKPKPDDMRLVGARLRGSLSVLAIKWFGPVKRPRTRTYVSEGALPMIITAGGTVEPGRAAHAEIDRRGRFSVKDGRPPRKA